MAVPTAISKFSASGRMQRKADIARVMLRTVTDVMRIRRLRSRIAMEKEPMGAYLSAREKETADRGLEKLI